MKKCLFLVVPAIVCCIAATAQPYDEETPRQIELRKEIERDEAEFARQYRESIKGQETSLFSLNDAFNIIMAFYQRAVDAKLESDLSKKKASEKFDAMLTATRLAEAANGGKLKAIEYYSLSNEVVKAIIPIMDNVETTTYLKGDSILQAYVKAYPDQPQGYAFRRQFAYFSDKDTSRGLLLEPTLQQNTFYNKNLTVYKNKLYFNDVFLVVYYADYEKSIPKEEAYQKALDATEAMKQLYPDQNSTEYKYATVLNVVVKKSADRYRKKKK